MYLPQNWHFHCEWDTKEGTGKSMKKGLYVPINIKQQKIKPVASDYANVKASG